MNFIVKNDGIYIFWDLDDVLVNSSPLLQKQVDSKTCFKTGTLKFLEQLKRNCEYYSEEVKKECALAFSKKRMPHLKKFPNFELSDFNIMYPHFNFNRMTKEQYENMFVNPIKASKYYSEIVDLLLNQFLEERDSFLEKDNLSKGQYPKYDYEKEIENIKYFSELINNNRIPFLKINEYCLGEVERLSEEAQKLNVNKPNYGSLIKMDSNDIIRENNINSGREYLLYTKPIQEVDSTVANINALDDIVNNFWEYMNDSREIIDYRVIYSKDNVNYDAVNVIRKLEDCPFVAGQAIISHHNGMREEYYKKSLVDDLFHGAVPFIGMRFHDSEHIGERRKRSDKYPESEKYVNLNPERKMLFDDSTANDDMWEKHGAKAVLYRRLTDAELILSKIANTGFRRITEFEYNEIVNIIKEQYDAIKGKQKVK